MVYRKDVGEIIKTLSDFAVECYTNYGIIFEWSTDYKHERDEITYRFKYKNDKIVMIRCYYDNKETMDVLGYLELALTGFRNEFLKAVEKE